MVDMVNLKLNGKWDMFLPAHRAARPEWLTGWEVERIDSMMSNVSLTDIVFDIGTEEGDISALLATKAFGIVMFEPNVTVWPNIRAIWEANNLKNPLAWYVGFASASKNDSPPLEDKMNFVNVDGWPACAYDEVIGAHGFSQLAEEADRTPQITLDEFVEVTGIVPNLITMDVEGSELEVLRGSGNILKNHSPIVYISIHPEFIQELYGCPAKSVHEYMESFGYIGTHLATDHEEHWMYRKNLQ
jgi:FkbM family methyltransferase